MMLNLEKATLLQVDPISHKDTMRLLPIGKNSKQKVVVGDDGGYLRSYDFKNGEPITSFNIKAFDGPISCVALGGSNPARLDKIFASYRQKMTGFTKKGKDFFTLSSSLSEDIEGIWIEDTLVWTQCEYICNQYDDGKDVAFFMSRDVINCMSVNHVLHARLFDAVLGCQDNNIRFMQGTDLTLEITTAGPVTAISARRLAKVAGTPPLVFYGIEGGTLVCLKFTRNQLDMKSIRKKTGGEIDNDEEYAECWQIPDSRQTRSSITCIQVFDLTRNGAEDIIVSREDGRIEVYTQELGQEEAAGLHLHKPRLAFSHDVGEKVQALQCGKVNSPTHNEIVAATYSGKVLSFTTERISEDDSTSTTRQSSSLASARVPIVGGDSHSSTNKSTAEVNNENRIKHMHKEIEALQESIEKTKGKISKLEVDSPLVGLPFSSPSGRSNSKSVIQSSDFSSSAKFFLDREKALYILSVEIQSPMEMVIVRSPVKLEVVEHDLNTSLVSVTPEHLLHPGLEDGDPCNFIAAIRSQTGEKRSKVALRPREGLYGDILVTIVTATNPKMAKPIKFSLRPLSLHMKCHTVSESERAKPRSSITFTGNFSLLVALEWLQAVIPDIAPNLDEGTASEEFWFRSTYSGALAVCVLESEKITFESQSASTVAIFKEAITRQANFRRTQLEETSHVSVESVYAFLELFRDKLAQQLSLVRKHAMIPAIKEVVMAESAASGVAPSWLQGEYMEIHKESEKIERKYKERGQVLEYITSVITALHTDFKRLQGLQALSNPAAVKEAALSGHWDEVVKLVVGQNHKSVAQALPPRRSSSQWEPDYEGGGELDEEYQ